jgi:hypothetical protein
MGPSRLKVIERWNLAFGALAILIAALVAPGPVMWGVACGAAMACLNFYAIRRIWQGILSGSTERRMAMQALFVFKSIALIALVVLALFFLPISPIGFVIGLSVFIPSNIVETARFALATPASGQKT